jgi:uncharacterized protein (DUF952 family)/DNA-binding transcriptional MerR regulator
METEHIIYHLTPADYFNSLSADKPYAPREFGRDGFIHCTKGEERLLLVADTIYRRVPGDFLALVIDEGKLTSPLKYENVGGIMFPHIYGLLNRDAIVRVVTMGRREDGTFLPIGEPDYNMEQVVATEAWLSQARTEQLLAESTELRAKTIKRLLSIEAEISNIKSQISKQVFPPEAQTPIASAQPVAMVASAILAAPVAVEPPAPTLEARVAQLEAEVSSLKSQISSLQSRLPKTKRAIVKGGKRAPRRKSAI